MSAGSMSDEGKAQPLALQGAVNVLVRGLLGTPLIARGIGRRLITLHVVGRRTGKRYHVPVAYVPHDGALLVGTPFAWARNLRTGDPVQVRYLGKTRTADVRVHADEEAVVADYDVIARQNRNFASFNKIGFDEQGNPRREDLHRAWTNGARVIRLTLR